MDTRRKALKIILGLAGNTLLVRASKGQQSPDRFAKFDSDLSMAANDPQMVEDAHKITELFLRQRGPTAEDFAIQPHLPKTYFSEKKISDRAKALMITFEVTGRYIYERKYIHPILPGVKSGLTIGIGYDIGYSSAQDFEEDWAPFIAPNVIARLKPACGRPGESEVTKPSNYSDIEIPWAAAEKQFEIAIKQAAGQTAHVFPRSSELSPDSFGALVDLVYNRGGALKRDPSDPDDRRREMRAIRQMLLTGRLKDIPDQLMSMRRLWLGDSKATGLLKRRETEAELFKAGLA